MGGGGERQGLGREMVSNGEREREKETERERNPPLNSAAAVVSDLTQAPIMTPCSQLLASNTKGTPVGQPPLITGTGTGTGIRQGSILTKTATAHNLVQHQVCQHCQSGSCQYCFVFCIVLTNCTFTHFFHFFNQKWKQLTLGPGYDCKCN